MRRFACWHREGTYSCTGTCFDIGATTAAALRRFERTGNAFAGSTAPDTAGNGSIMRLAPVAVRQWREPGDHAADRPKPVPNHPRRARGRGRLRSARRPDRAGHPGSALPDLVTSAAAGRVRGFRPGQPRHEVRGTGYVVASLHAALWTVSRTSTFKDAVLLAANLGQDADTTAAVAGQIAGALYGASGIPEEWLARLAWRERIERMAAGLFDAGADRLAA